MCRSMPTLTLTSAVALILNYLELGISPSDEKSFADLLLTCTCSCYLFDFMHFDLGENEASHQGPICAVCVDFGHGKTHSWRLGRGTGQWQRSLVRWGPFDQQCNAALVNVLTQSLRIDFITVFRSQTSRIFRRSVLFKSFVILELKYHSVWV